MDTKTFRSSTIQTWGGVLDRLPREYASRYAAGIVEIRLCVDYCVPSNKAIEQKSRLKAMLSTVAREGEKKSNSDVKRQPYEWPTLDDGRDWFAKEQSCQCSLNEIYYSKSKVAKRKFMQFLTRFFLYELPIPPGRRLLVDCGVDENLEWFDAPRIVSLVHPLGDHATVDEVLHAAKLSPGCVRRRIDRVKWHPERFWSFCEGMYAVFTLLKSAQLTTGSCIMRSRQRHNRRRLSWLSHLTAILQSR